MDKEKLKLKCLESIEKNKDFIIRFGNEVYQTPELGFKEFNTTKRIEEAFRKIGFEPETEIAYTGCKASSSKKDGPKVAVMGELDCIMCTEHPDSLDNGNVHACGHHAQLANLLGCALGLKTSGVLDQLQGSVDFIAIPAEECVDYDYRNSLIQKGKISFYGGKQEYLARGGIDEVDMILQCHMMEMEDKRKRCIIDTEGNGFVTKTVKFVGEAAHAGFAPFCGVNALNMASLALQNIHALRETFKDEDKVRVSNVITEGGGLVNVVPSVVKMQIMVRAFTIPAMLDASRKVNRALKAGALAVGGKVEIHDQMGYLPLKTDRRLSALYKQNMIDYAGASEDSFVELYKTAGSTDLGDMSQMKPCMHIWTEGITGGLHTKDYRLADPELAYIVPAKMMALTIIDLLYNDAEKAKEIIQSYKPAFTKISYLEFMKKHSKLEFFDGSKL
ncbi:MAG: amidohydrolase [Lachnospiraceae bacterium]|nr:amidohydrolase [Lachnospiraceae bacterium]